MNDHEFSAMVASYVDTKKEYERFGKTEHPEYLHVCEWLEKNKERIEKLEL